MDFKPIVYVAILIASCSAGWRIRKENSAEHHAGHSTTKIITPLVGFFKLFFQKNPYIPSLLIFFFYLFPKFFCIVCLFYIFFFFLCVRRERPDLARSELP